MTLSEEKVTRELIRFHQREGWNVVSFDLPETGAGERIPPNNRQTGTKQRGSIVPDIVAVNGEILRLVESKPKFDMNDVRKLELVLNGEYSQGIERKFGHLEWESVEVSIGLPIAENSTTLEKKASRLDLSLFIQPDGGIEILRL